MSISGAEIAQIQTLARGWLKDLLRFDSTNPPGNEKPVIAYVERLLSSWGLSSRILAKSEERPNLFTQISANDPSTSARPILLSSHVDVVPTGDTSKWKYPPFSATEADGFIWGRGAIDMKYKTALDLAAFYYFKSRALKRNLKLLVLADEEIAGEYGAAFVTQSHLPLIEGALVFNEVGGFSSDLFGQPVVLVQAGEKSCCPIRITATGPTAHASIEYPQNAILLLSRALLSLRERFVSYHLTQSTKCLLQHLATRLPAPQKALIDGLLDAAGYRAALSQIPDVSQRCQIAAMLTNTINPTQLNAGFKLNVIPDSAVAHCDCRLLPGVSASAFVTQIKECLSKEMGSDAAVISVESVAFEAGYEVDIKGEVFDAITEVVSSNWATARPGLSTLPYLMPAASDSTKFAAKGLIPYGFAPLYFPEGYDGFSQYHAIDERIPVEAFNQGVACYLRVLEKLLV